MSAIVYIDACLVDVVDALWSAGVVTRSVCCGHGDCAPEILVHQRDSAKAREICGDRADIAYWNADGSGIEVER